MCVIEMEIRGCSNPLCVVSRVRYKVLDACGRNPSKNMERAVNCGGRRETVAGRWASGTERCPACVPEADEWAEVGKLSQVPPFFNERRDEQCH